MKKKVLLILLVSVLLTYSYKAKAGIWHDIVKILLDKKRPGPGVPA